MTIFKNNKKRFNQNIFDNNFQENGLKLNSLLIKYFKIQNLECVIYQLTNQKQTI